MHIMPNTPNNKRKELSIKEKLEILQLYDKLPKMSQRCAATQLKISQPLLCKILKNRIGIENFVRQNKNTVRKRNRGGKDRQVEAALKLWFSECRVKNIPVNGHMLREKAKELAKEMGKDFIATDGWFSRWKKRENIVYKRNIPSLNRKCEKTFDEVNVSKDHKSWGDVPTSVMCQVVIKSEGADNENEIGMRNEDSTSTGCKLLGDAFDNRVTSGRERHERCQNVKTKNEELCHIKAEKVADVYESLEEPDFLENSPGKEEMLQALRILRCGLKYRTTELKIHYEYEVFINQLLKNE